ncbi:MAG: dipeptide/oligopeptide/nickel ABC transporter ATP-binding protein, partial [Oscillospiraceae bacterium]|nr:dipeptide/oligopeptide/nickel ABC transporter ATP-binding protein [Oscillospiraceae bacterium]
RGWSFGRAKARPVKALDGVSFTVARGETFGVVGESGCGKTTLGKCIVRLLEPDEGKIFFKGEGLESVNLLALDKKRGFEMRRRIQMIFQDPYGSLNPRLNILSSFDEPLKVHGFGNRERRREIVAEMLERVNLQPDYMYRYPHEFSGGQRQRICIARALALKPELIVCDEP